MADLHPSVELLSKDMEFKSLTLKDVATGTGIKLSRLELVMSGQRQMLLEEQDQLCEFLGIPVWVHERRVEKEQKRRRSAAPPTYH